MSRRARDVRLVADAFNGIRNEALRKRALDEREKIVRRVAVESSTPISWRSTRV